MLLLISFIPHKKSGSGSTIEHSIRRREIEIELYIYVCVCVYLVNK